MLGIWGALAAIAAGVIANLAWGPLTALAVIVCLMPGALVGAVMCSRSRQAGYEAGRQSRSDRAEPVTGPATELVDLP